MLGQTKQNLTFSQAADPHALRASSQSIDRFVDALWLEDGLARNTLDAYRRDLQGFAQWLARQTIALDKATEAELTGYMSARHEGSKATSANRRLTVFKRYYRWAMREGVLHVDPTLKLLSAKQLLRVPKTLTD